MKLLLVPFWIYLVFLHLVLGVILACAIRRGDGLGALIWTSNGKHEYYYRQMSAFHQRVDEMLPSNVVLFVGDSSIQGLDVSSVTEQGVNFGIGGDTVAGVLARIGTYRSLDSASALVLAVGYNDLKIRENHEIVSEMGRLLVALPPKLKVVCCGVYPTDERIRTEKWNRRIANLNRSYEQLCSARAGTVFVDFHPILADAAGNLQGGYGLDDGLHLSLAGRNAVVRELRLVLSRVGPARSRVGN
jgi:lysophospholipase L1-like esterase